MVDSKTILSLKQAIVYKNQKSTLFTQEKMEIMKAKLAANQEYWPEKNWSKSSQESFRNEKKNHCLSKLYISRIFHFINKQKKKFIVSWFSAFQLDAAVQSCVYLNRFSNLEDTKHGQKTPHGRLRLYTEQIRAFD